MTYMLAKPYYLLFNELSKEKYQTYSVYEYFIEKRGKPKNNKINVVIRIDVDSGLETCDFLSNYLKENKINACFYFLTHPHRYYDIWSSPIPKIVSEKGFEVGLHTDHYYEELTLGKNAIENIKKDVKKLSTLIGKPIKGMVYHGHNEIDAWGKTNCDVYKNVHPKELGLIYHDFTIGMGPEQDKTFNYYHILDYLGIVNGWRFFPQYPIKKLRRMKLGDTVVIFMHPENAFKTETLFKNLKHFLRIRIRYQLIDPFIRGNSARLYIYILLPKFLKPILKNSLLKKLNDK